MGGQITTCIEEIKNCQNTLKNTSKECLVAEQMDTATEQEELQQWTPRRQGHSAKFH